MVPHQPQVRPLVEMAASLLQASQQRSRLSEPTFSRTRSRCLDGTIGRWQGQASLLGRHSGMADPADIQVPRSPLGRRGGNRYQVLLARSASRVWGFQERSQFLVLTASRRLSDQFLPQNRRYITLSSWQGPNLQAHLCLFIFCVDSSWLWMQQIFPAYPLAVRPVTISTPQGCTWPGVLCRDPDCGYSTGMM